MRHARSLSSGIRRSRMAFAWGVLFLASCAGAPPAPAPGRGTLFGRVTLCPHEGVRPGSKELTVYADRRLRDVEFVDYGRIEFAVVYLEGEASAGGAVLVTLEPAFLGGPRLVPRESVLGKGGRVQIRNSDARPHTLSCPRAGRVQILGPSETASFVADSDGEWSIFVLDLPEAEARLFVPPGPWTTVSRDGRWELRDLVPGPRTLRVWHPRFPPAARAVTVPPDDVVRVDVALSVESVREGD
jgi:hypothetical protein